MYCTTWRNQNCHTNTSIQAEDTLNGISGNQSRLMMIKSFEIVLKSSRYWGNHSNCTQLKWAVRIVGQVRIF